MGKQVLNVLMISPRFKPLVGGYERSAERLAGELASRGHHVVVAAQREDPSWPRSEVVAGASVQRLWYSDKPRLRTLSAFWSYALYMLRQGRRMDVVHIHQYGKVAALVIYLGKLLGVPTVLKLTNTGPEGLADADSIRNPLIRKLVLGMLRKADGYLAISEATKREALDFGIPQDRLFVVPNGVDTETFFPSPLAREQRGAVLGIQAEALVLYSARLGEGKNPLGLLEAWQRVSAKFPQAVLVYLGEGPLEQALRERVEVLGLSGKVVVAGLQREVLPWYQAADVYVVSSLREGLSNSLLEAMSCGLPIVSTRVSGSEDIFQRADIGELVAPGSVDGLADGLDRLLSNPGRRKVCGANARRYLEETYALRKVGTEVEQVYRVLIDRHSSR